MDFNTDKLFPKGSYVYYSEYKQRNLVELDLGTGNTLVLAENVMDSALHGLEYVDGTVYGITWKGEFFSLSPEAPAAKVIAENVFAYKVSELRRDPKTGTLYVVTLEDGLYSIDPATGTTQKAADWSGVDDAYILALAIDPDGNAYATGTFNSLFSVSLSTGVLTEKLDPGRVNYAQSLVYLPDAEGYLWGEAVGEIQIHFYDPAKNTLEDVYTLPLHFHSLFLAPNGALAYTMTIQNGEEKTEMRVSRLKKFDLSVLPEPVVEEGFRFGGWVTEDGTPVDENFNPDHDVTVLPKQIRILDIEETGLDFGGAEVGYGEIGAQTLKVSNSLLEEGTLTVILPESETFEVTLASGNLSLLQGESLTLSVRPKTGLKPGNYETQLTLLSEEGYSDTVQLSFTVTENPDTGSGANTVLFLFIAAAAAFAIWYLKKKQA